MNRLGERLRHGTELDHCHLSAAGGRSVLIPPKLELQAFDPAGPAYSGEARSVRNSELFQRRHWYLAEQLFADPKPNSRAKRSGEDAGLHGRLVLIRANAPEEAYLRAVANGQRCDRRRHGDGLEPGSFRGLVQLSIVEHRLRNACILRTDEYFATTGEVKRRIGPQEMLRRSTRAAGTSDPHRHPASHRSHIVYMRGKVDIW
jgi:hypothetical protein